MVPLAAFGTTAKAACGAPVACDGAVGRLGSSWRGQHCWRGSSVAPHPLWRRTDWRHVQHRRRRGNQQQAHAALLDPPPFDPSKLNIEYLPGGREAALAAGPRRYTLTHNDVTGTLQLAIGREYNRRQLDWWYTRMLRDEILAEWQDTAPPTPGRACSGAAAGGPRPQPSLHVFCHVSGEELWPAPPQLRSFVFQREMALVLDTISFAEGGPDGLLALAPHLEAAPVYVHLRSDLPALDRVVEWGVLGRRDTWRTATSSIARSLLSSVMGTMDEADATDGSNGSWSRSSFTTASGSSWDEVAPGAAGGCGSNGAGSSSSSLYSNSQSAELVLSEQQEQQRQQQQQQQLPFAQQQQQQQYQAMDGGAGMPAQTSLALTQAAEASGSAASNGNGAGISGGSNPRMLANGSKGPSSGGGGSLGAANGAVSLAGAQQERDVRAWRGEGVKRMPAVEAAATRHR